MANTISLSQILKARPTVCPTIYGYTLPDVPNHNGYIKIGYTDKEDVEKRIREFINFLKEKYPGKTVGILAHRAPQLALDVIIKGLSWEDAILSDWRKTGAWQPGWEYIIKD